MAAAAAAGVDTTRREKQTFTSGRIAVVRPFIPSHVDRLVADMASWELPEFSPCHDVDHDAGAAAWSATKPDLVLYFSYPLDQFPDVVATVRRAWVDARWRRCFADVKLMSAGLDAEADRYLPNQKTASSAKEKEGDDQPAEREPKRPAPSGSCSCRLRACALVN
jgi:hypothetical protein